MSWILCEWPGRDVCERRVFALRCVWARWRWRAGSRARQLQGRSRWGRRSPSRALISGGSVGSRFELGLEISESLHPGYDVHIPDTSRLSCSLPTCALRGGDFGGENTFFETPPVLTFLVLGIGDFDPAMGIPARGRAARGETLDATLALSAGLPLLAIVRATIGEVTLFFSACPSLADIVRGAEVLFWSCWTSGLLVAAGFLLAAVSLPTGAASSGFSFF